MPSHLDIENLQFDSILVLAFAVIALALAAAEPLRCTRLPLITQRTSEIGIRLALGAPVEQMLQLVLFVGVRPALFGLVLGLAASAALVHT